MNIAIIFAGGTGQRMNSLSKPKQFLELHGKPILIHTMEHFENHSEIDGIIVVCVAEWHAYCKLLIEKFSIKKVKFVLNGGQTGMESIKLGLYKAREFYEQNTVILIHDGVRPLIDEKTISDNLKCVKKNGNSITVSHATETIATINEENSVGGILDRSYCYLAKAPQCFLLKDICDAHERAQQDNLKDFIDSASLMKYYNHKLNIVIGPSENIKITTPSDFYIFRAISDARENHQIFGI